MPYLELSAVMPHLAVQMAVLVQTSSKHQAEASMEQHPVKQWFEVSAEC